MANISYGVNIIPKTNNAYTLGNSDYKWSNIYAVQINGTNVSDLGSVQDVQINSTSILNNGVANIPVMNSNDYGVAKIASYTGVKMDSNGCLNIRVPSEENIKPGTNGNYGLAPSVQHISTFYGLAKAAGDSTQAASSNAVGAYTDNAKIQIQKMLGVYQQPWEFIREDTFTNETEADHTITLDANNEAFDLTDIIFMFETPKQETDAAKGTYGQIHFYYGASDYFSSESGAWTQAANSSAHGFVVRIIQEPGGMFWCQETQSTASTNSAPWRTRYFSTFKSGSQGLRMLENNYVRHITKIVIKTVTGTGHYLLYGKRAIT